MNYFRKNSFDAVFLSLSFFFIFYFYLLPLLFVFFDPESVSYHGVPLHSESRILLAISSLVVFLMGFFSIDVMRSLYRKVREEKYERMTIENGKVTRLFWFLVLVLFTVLIYKLYTIDPNVNYAIRRGQIKGNHLNYLGTLMFEMLKVAVIFAAISLVRRRAVVLALLILFVLVDIKSAVGRTNLLLSLSLILLFIFKIKAIHYSRICFWLFLLIIPLVLSLKHIIFMVSTNNFESGFFSSFDFDLYMANFGHPLVSMMYSRELMDVAGVGYFSGYFNSVLFYLKFFGFDVDYSLTYYNTYVLLGAKESNIPPGHLAFGFVQLSFIGVFFSGYLYRMLGVFANIVYRKLNVENEAVKFYLAFIAANSFYHGDFRILLLTIIVPFLFLVIAFPFLAKKSHSN